MNINNRRNSQRRPGYTRGGENAVSPPPPPLADMRPPAVFRHEPVRIYTPANCRKLRSLKLISGSSETGTAVSVTIDGCDEYIVLADESRRWRLADIELSPGFHAITAKYTEGPSYPPAKVWVYIIGDISLPAPEITYPSQGETISEAQPVITGKAIAGSLVIVTIDGCAEITSAIAGGDGSFRVQPQFALYAGEHNISAMQKVSKDLTSPKAFVSFIVSMP